MWGGGEGEPENEVDSSFKNYHLMGHGRLDSILGSCSVPAIDFSSHNPSKIPALDMVGFGGREKRKKNSI